MEEGKETSRHEKIHEPLVKLLVLIDFDLGLLQLIDLIVDLLEAFRVGSTEILTTRHIGNLLKRFFIKLHAHVSVDGADVLQMADEGHPVRQAELGRQCLQRLLVGPASRQDQVKSWFEARYPGSRLQEVSLAFLGTEPPDVPDENGLSTDTDPPPERASWNAFCAVR